MKKLTPVIAACMLMITSTAFARPGEKVSEVIQTSFQKNFSGALHVKWEKTHEFYFVQFDLNKCAREAAFNEEGELVGMSRKVHFDQLPLKVAAAITSNYGSYAVDQVISEIVLEGETSYYLNVENNTAIFKLKCTPEGNIYITKKVRKNNNNNNKTTNQQLLVKS